VIRGELVGLGPVLVEDKERLFEWINDPQTVRFNAPFRPVSPAMHERWFQAIGSDPSRILFAVRILADATLVGTVQLVGIHPVHRSAELIIRIGDERQRGRGYGTEAVQLLVDFAWHDLNLHRVFLHVFADNERAIRVYRNAGFAEEGRLVEAAFIDGTWRDVLVMAVRSERDTRRSGGTDSGGGSTRTGTPMVE
jgi:RimJ/RimL family protein N-acetyltransferase